MICPNCRCFIPTNTIICEYCGFKFLSESGELWKTKPAAFYLYADPKTNQMLEPFNSKCFLLDILFEIDDRIPLFIMAALLSIVALLFLLLII